MAVTFRDVSNIERGSIGDDGRLEDFRAVAAGVPTTFWETLIKRVAVEGEVFEATAEALLYPGIGVERRDIIICRDRRWEVLQVFPGRNLSAVYRFDHVVLREAV